MSSYDKEVTKLNTTRDKAILDKIDMYFRVIQDKSKKLAMDVTDKAKDNTDYFRDYNRAETFATKTNKELRPEYLAKDTFVKQAYINEYPTAYIQSLYTIVNTGIDEGYLVKLPKYTEKQFKKAINNPLSKIMSRAKQKTARSVDIEQIYTTIVSGVESGLSLPNINRQIDINLGYRDATTGKLIEGMKDKYKGQQYKTQRVLRTEVLRMRAQAETDQWINQQDIVPSKLQLVETLDDRTRSQSANMDGQFANKEGKFKFPNGNYSYAHNSGVAKWDINDRSSVITLDEEFPTESRIQRDPKTGKNTVEPFQNFEQYAKDKNLKVNRYGEALFP